ncbi:hypothetical protein AGMMS49992_15860 [Clostridia bacterium]|nr:hypothetical protein AGMMS49992_15860 [Clostridia bacterium]
MIRTYPTPPFEPTSADYDVSVGGITLHASPIRVSAMPVNQIFRGVQRGKDETELASYVSFEGDQPASLRVTVGFDVFCVRVVPASAGITLTIHGRNITFTLPKPGSYTLEVNGVHKPLHIFFNPLEIDAPDPNDDAVLYFAPGLHNAGRIEMKSGQTLYIAGGARVRGYVVVYDAQNVCIQGRGLIDVSNIPRLANQNAIHISRSSHIRVEGIILHDAPCFAVTVANSEYVEIDNAKVIGQWRYNSDGIDLYNSRHAIIRNCFVRTFDDCIVLKGGYQVAGRSMEHVSMSDILVEDCVLWNDWGRALEIGAETIADEMRDITFRHCEVLHFLFIACDVQACGDAYVHDVLFEDINVGEPLDPQCEPRLTEIFIRPMCWLSAEKLSHVGDITFRNIAYTGRTCVPNRYIGFGEESDVQRVSLENITINGQRLTEAGHPMSQFIYNRFANVIAVDGKPIDMASAFLEDEKATCSSFLIGNGAFVSK